MTMSMSGPVPPDQIRQLPTPDLALRLLDGLAKSGTVDANTTMRSAQQAFEFSKEKDVDFLLGRLSDAWAWLEAHSLIGPHGKNGCFGGLSSDCKRPHLDDIVPDACPPRLGASKLSSRDHRLSWILGSALWPASSCVLLHSRTASRHYADPRSSR